MTHDDTPDKESVGTNSVAQRLNELEVQVASLTDELQSERQQRREQTHALARENRELREHVSEVENTVENENGSKIDALFNAREYLSERIEDVEDKLTSKARSLDDGDLQNTLPIQQTTRLWKVGGTINAKKTEHAAALWSDFMDRCKKGSGVFYLDTEKAKSILREHFRDDDRHIAVGTDVSRSTVHRAIDAAVDLGGELLQKKTVNNGRSALVVNRGEFEEFIQTLEAADEYGDTVTDGVTGEHKTAVTGAP